MRGINQRRPLSRAGFRQLHPAAPLRRGLRRRGRPADMFSDRRVLEGGSGLRSRHLM